MILRGEWREFIFNSLGVIRFQEGSWVEREYRTT